MITFCFYRYITYIWTHAFVLLNDKYEYDDITIPFLAELGRKIYDNELARDKKHLPDFERFIN